jgi:hypothetical protein
MGVWVYGLGLGLGLGWGGGGGGGRGGGGGGGWGTRLSQQLEQVLPGVKVRYVREGVEVRQTEPVA